MAISAKDFGVGRPIVFIHGWRLDGAVEAADMEPVFHVEDHWRRIYLDLPGMGDSPPDDRISNLNDYLDVVLRFIDGLLDEEPFAIAGTSAGAALARAVAHSRHERIRGLLLRVPMFRSSDADRTGGLHFDSDTARDIYFDSDPDEPWLPQAFVEEAVSKREFLWEPARERAAETGFVEPIRNDPARYTLRGDFSDTLTVPALVIAGRQDRRVGYEDALASLPQYPRATLAVLDRANHVLPTGDRRLFDALVRDWLTRMHEVWPDAPDPVTAYEQPKRLKRWLVGKDLYPSTKTRTPKTWFVLRRHADSDDTRLLYEKTFETLTIFLDWRYKSMSIGFAVLAGAVALDEWLFVHSGQHWALAGPLLVVAAFCVVVRKFDARNQTILNDAYEAGAELEVALGATRGAMMERIPTQRPLWTYHETIKVVFGWIMVLCVVASIALIAWSIWGKATHHPSDTKSAHAKPSGRPCVVCVNLGSPRLHRSDS